MCFSCIHLIRSLPLPLAASMHTFRYILHSSHLCFVRFPIRNVFLCVTLNGAHLAPHEAKQFRFVSFHHEFRVTIFFPLALPHRLSRRVTSAVSFHFSFVRLTEAALDGQSRSRATRNGHGRNKGDTRCEKMNAAARTKRVPCQRKAQRRQRPRERDYGEKCVERHR